ncbi:MAG: ribulokinase [Lentisphaerae bacterium]|nr:ribulokinase [Lentisphaerota bacterium]
MNSAPAFAMGLDFGSTSVRAVVVDCRDGREAGSGVWSYRSGEAGVLTDPRRPHLARQNPLDYLEGLRHVVPAALAAAAASRRDFRPEAVIGIGVDATSSTPIPVDAQCRPLAADPHFAGDLDAQAWMWKDHTAIDEAEAITALARERRPRYLAQCGGACSPEWFFSKIWHCQRVAPAVFAAAHAWLEFADFIPAALAGVQDSRAVRAGICAAGHKAMYNDAWGGYPDAEFLAALSPEMAALRERLPRQAVPADQVAGRLTASWAAALGLPAGLPIAVGGIDAHLGAVGAGVAPGRMVAIIGTSACDILVAPPGAAPPEIPGVCGIVPGSVLPDCLGIEAGQCAVGDIMHWFVTEICRGEAALHGRLSAAAAALRPGQSGLLALDWHNGNRSILADARLTGLLVGMTLHTSQADIYRALIEATAFGARRILDQLESHGVGVEDVVACGGIAEKNPLFMQIYADVLGRPMRLSASTQTCALGAAIMGAVAAGTAAGGYASVAQGQEAACAFQERVYRPDPAAAAVYQRLYALYLDLHDSFGRPRTTFDHAGVMKGLLEIRRQAEA